MPTRDRELKRKQRQRNNAHTKGRTGRIISEIKSAGCQVCGYNRCLPALEFHHVDPSKKQGLVSVQGGMSFTVLFRELEKCIVVCANCHREIHAGLLVGLVERIPRAYDSDQEPLFDLSLVDCSCGDGGETCQ